MSPLSGKAGVKGTAWEKRLPGIWSHVMYHLYISIWLFLGASQRNLYEICWEKKWDDLWDQGGFEIKEAIHISGVKTIFLKRDKWALSPIHLFFPCDWNFILKSCCCYIRHHGYWQKEEDPAYHLKKPPEKYHNYLRGIHSLCANILFFLVKCITA